jgi:hypothetical protein
MRVRRHPTNLRRMLASRLKRVAASKRLLIASLVETYRLCGKPTCRCTAGFKHRAYQLTFKEGGKTRTVHVPADLTEEVRSWIAEYRRLKRLFQEISELTLELVRCHVQERKRRHNRSGS